MARRGYKQAGPGDEERQYVRPEQAEPGAKSVTRTRQCTPDERFRGGEVRDAEDVSFELHQSGQVTVERPSYRARFASREGIGL